MYIYSKKRKPSDILKRSSLQEKVTLLYQEFMLLHNGKKTKSNITKLSLLKADMKKQRELSVDNIQLAYGGISSIRASYYKDREGKPLHMYIYLK